MTLPLSVLDLSPVSSGRTSGDAVRETIELAQSTERDEYQRFWVAEHHNIASVASTAPPVMIASVAAATATIRVGAGGIMLPNHAPLQVAETFRVLEALHPGRIDLGLGRAPGTDQLTALALRRSREALGADDFPQQYAELIAYVDGFPEEHPFRPISAQPTDVPLPPVWILGSSLYGAQAAGAFGTPFAFAGHFGTADPVEAMDAYRSSFRPQQREGAMQEPHSLLAVAAITSADSERARQLGRAAALSMVRLRQNRPGPLPSPEEAHAYSWTDLDESIGQAFGQFATVGTPEEVAAGIRRRAEACGADELMITTNVHDAAERRESYSLLAKEWGLVSGS
ncbi:LLM class flavin-dependent oxidoreductase [Luteipulveratus mongoliensis]|uniref:5,10-methylene tetrahydromethanopterin reductase n=1 Tax=Luteipulveratus mongoliensis TaxID=571913 RepID=A0A0K1JJF5_9MICO|nr:LLM class flavin-dependent oxidoreductase [Luteipulveratus mongoliensis]AKU16852.1 5,10-methylene tetrahydromethanopterin reductase [Luteipulveratus mongoliensis]